MIGERLDICVCVRKTKNRKFSESIYVARGGIRDLTWNDLKSITIN